MNSRTAEWPAQRANAPGPNAVRIAGHFRRRLSRRRGRLTIVDSGRLGRRGRLGQLRRRGSIVAPAGEQRFDWLLRLGSRRSGRLHRQHDLLLDEVRHLQGQRRFDLAKASKAESSAEASRFSCSTLLLALLDKPAVAPTGSAGGAGRPSGTFSGSHDKSGPAHPGAFCDLASICLNACSRLMEGSFLIIPDAVWRRIVGWVKQTVVLVGLRSLVESTSCRFTLSTVGSVCEAPPGICATSTHPT